MRDIAELAERNMVTRVHDGANLPQSHRQACAARSAGGLTVRMVVPSLDHYWPAIPQALSGSGVCHGASGDD